MALKDIAAGSPSSDGYKLAQLALDISTTNRRKLDRFKEEVDKLVLADVITAWEAESPGTTQELADLFDDVVPVANHNLPAGQSARVAPVKQSDVPA